MSQQTASRTALATAYMRAAHQLLDPPPRILEDPVAIAVLGPGAEQVITASAARAQTPEGRALRAHIVLRSRFAEDRLAAAAGRGVTQYAILGAGFDTFVVRQPAWAHALRILEVDHEGTQTLKRSYLAAAGLSVPSNAGFATLDFERESLHDGLVRHAISPAAPTFFSWLGVTMYLREAAIDVVLQSVAKFPAGSEIVLTFAPPDTPRPVFERAAQAGEPWLSFFEPPQMQDKLRAAGFTSIELLTPALAASRYFQAPSSLPAPQRTTIVAAVR